MNKPSISLRPLHVRILFPHLLTLSKSDPKRFIPPRDITSSKAIDLELYTYFALLLRDFIHPWYRLVTTDEDLSSEILDILIILVQRLETRLCNEVDWTEIVLIDLPKLLTIHYQDYRHAKKRLYMDHGGGCQSLADLFHGMQPHFALQQQPTGQEQEYLRILTESILKILLNPQEYESDCVRHLVREILSNLVLFNLIEVLADPYTIHSIVCKLLASYEPMLDELEATGQFSETYFSAMTNGQSPQTLKPDLIKTQFQPSQDIQLAKKEQEESLTRQMARLQEQQRQKEGITGSATDDEFKQTQEIQEEGRRRFSFAYITLQVILAPFRNLWSYIMAIMTQSQESYQRVNQHKKKTRHMRLVEPVLEFMSVACQIRERPKLQWAWHMLAMFFWPLIRVFGGGLLVDKFLEQTVFHLLSEDHIVFYLRMGSDLLWPDGVFLQRVDPPTPLQKEQIRVRAERLLTLSIPRNIRAILFETKELNQLQSHIHEVLEPLQNKQTNKHFLYLLVDLILGKVLPELLVNDVITFANNVKH